MNHFSIDGYVATEPKISVTQSGKKKATFNIAQRINKDKSQFVYVQCWEKVAEVAQNYAHKGEFIVAEGTISVYEKADVAGQKNSIIQLVINRLEVINTHRGQAQQTVTEQAQQPEYKQPEITADDLPF